MPLVSIYDLGSFTKQGATYCGGWKEMECPRCPAETRGYSEWICTHSSFSPTQQLTSGICNYKQQRRQWHPTPVLLPGKSMDRGAWKAAVHGVAKSLTRLSDFNFSFHFHALGKEMATHSSVLAWRIPGTGEPGGLLSMRSHRRGQD